MKEVKILLCLCMTLLLVGCGSKSPEAQQVIEMINSIKTVSLDKELELGEVENAYIGLSAEQRAEVTNYQKLKAYRKEMDKLVSEHPIPFSDVTFAMSVEDVKSILGEPDKEYDVDSGEHFLQYNDREFEGYTGTTRYAFDESELVRVLFLIEEYSDDIYNHFNELFTTKYGEPNYYASEYIKRWDKECVSIGFTATDLFDGSVDIVYISPDIELMSYSEAKDAIGEYTQYFTESSDNTDTMVEESPTAIVDNVQDFVSDKDTDDSSDETKLETLEEKASKVDDDNEDKQSVETEKKEQTPQTTPQSGTFRSFNWGASKEDIRATETASLVGETANGLTYTVDLCGVLINLNYMFDDTGKLTEALYATSINDADRNSAIDFYGILHDNLISVYGNSIKSIREPQGDYSGGFLIYGDNWSIENSDISLLMGFTNNSSGNNLMLDYKKK